MSDSFRLSLNGFGEKIHDRRFEYGVLTLFTTLNRTSKVVARQRNKKQELFLGRRGFLVRQECDDFRVMLVEDDEGFRRGLAGILISRFPSILLDEAANGAEAVGKVESFLPHLIFMDINLGGENGLEITKRVKALQPNIRVIILTSYDFPEYREAARASGAYCFLSKGSSTAEEIQDLVERLWAESGS